MAQRRPVPLAALGLMPAGSIQNRNHYLPRARVAPGLDEPEDVVHQEEDVFSRLIPELLRDRKG